MFVKADKDLPWSMNSESLNQRKYIQYNFVTVVNLCGVSDKIVIFIMQYWRKCQLRRYCTNWIQWKSHSSCRLNRRKWPITWPDDVISRVMSSCITLGPEIYLYNKADERYQFCRSTADEGPWNLPLSNFTSLRPARTWWPRWRTWHSWFKPQKNVKALTTPLRRGESNARNTNNRSFHSKPGGDW